VAKTVSPADNPFLATLPSSPLSPPIAEDKQPEESNIGMAVPSVTAASPTASSPVTAAAATAASTVVTHAQLSPRDKALVLYLLCEVRLTAPDMQHGGAAAERIKVWGEVHGFLFCLKVHWPALFEN
jgi:hypothetical protein